MTNAHSVVRVGSGSPIQCGFFGVSAMTQFDWKHPLKLCCGAPYRGFTNRSSMDRERFQMNNIEQFQKHAESQNEAAMASANTFAAGVKTIATAHAEYTKKAFQDGSEFISKLTSLKSPDEAMKLQADYAKSAYETFVAESKKIVGLYTDFAKQTFKPFEGLIAKMTPAK